MRLTSVLIASLLLAAPLQAQTAKKVPLTESEKRMQLLERKVKALTAQVRRLDTLQREVQQLRGQIEVQNHAMDALKKRQRDLYLDVDQRLTQAAPSAPVEAGSGESEKGAGAVTEGVVVVDRGEVVETPKVVVVKSQGVVPAEVKVAVPAVAPVAADPANEKRDYDAAFSLLMQRRYDEAITAFTTFLSGYSQGDYADNAQYWLAEGSYVTRDFDRALGEFQKVIQLYPESTKVPDAMLKAGFILYEKKQWPETRSVLEDLIKRYPVTSASRLAGKRLERMQKEGR